mgnify:CR=1 FL=1
MKKSLIDAFHTARLFSCALHVTKDDGLQLGIEVWLKLFLKELGKDLVFDIIQICTGVRHCMPDLTDFNTKMAATLLAFYVTIKSDFGWTQWPVTNCMPPCVSREMNTTQPELCQQIPLDPSNYLIQFSRYQNNG